MSSLYRFTSPVDLVVLTDPISLMSFGGSHTCVLMPDSGVKCWGFNDRGLLGDGTVVDWPVEIEIPVDVICPDCLPGDTVQ